MCCKRIKEIRWSCVGSARMLYEDDWDWDKNNGNELQMNDNTLRVN